LDKQCHEDPSGLEDQVDAYANQEIYVAKLIHPLDGRCLATETLEAEDDEAAWRCAETWFRSFLGPMDLGTSLKVTKKNRVIYKHAVLFVGGRNATEPGRQRRRTAGPSSADWERPGS
jgi:hypothetical protein